MPRNQSLQSINLLLWKFLIIVLNHNFINLRLFIGARGSLWLRHYATSLKVAGSRPDEVN
jgi:hypothetical protein